MVRLEIKLASEYDKTRPVFKNKNGIKILLDTGAEHPIWCSVSEVSKYYADSYATSREYIIGGLTGQPVLSDEIIIPQFEIIGKNDTKLVLRNLSLGLVENQEFNFDMILSPSALAVANFCIQQVDFNDKGINRSERNLVIESPRDILFCTVGVKKLEVGGMEKQIINYYSCYVSDEFHDKGVAEIQIFR